MKGFARKAMVCVIILSMFLSGCGTAMISLTEEEESIIVAYASGAVAKGNRCQTQGLTYYQPEEELQEEIMSPTEEDETQTEAMDTPMEYEQSDQTQPDSTTANIVTLTEAVGISGITAEYHGYQVSDSYVEGGYFAINAQEGNTYLVLDIALTNTTQQQIECNIYSKNMICRLLINDAEHIQAVTTIMLKDFLTYINPIEPGVTAGTVVIFEVPQEMAGNIHTLTMELEMNEILYHIELE